MAGELSLVQRLQPSGLQYVSNVDNTRWQGWLFCGAVGALSLKEYTVCSLHW